MVAGLLARGRRPGYFNGHSVPKNDVDTWLGTVRTFGIKSSEAARLLRTDYKTLHLKMKQYRVSGGAVQGRRDGRLAAGRPLARELRASCFDVRFIRNPEISARR